MTFVSCSDDEELSPLKTIPNGVKAVDLGLPSGTLWANMNVGALKEEGIGYHFAWGETEPRSDYDWGTYKWCNGSWRTMTKYCTESYYGYNGFTDNKTELDPMDDAAYVNWGKDWCMPSEEQFRELINSSYTNTKYIQKNGVYGLKITSKMNGNSIFLPASGESKGTSGGHCWSRTLYPDQSSNAWNLSFYNSDVYLDHAPRCRADIHNIRPVRNIK